MFGCLCCLALFCLFGVGLFMFLTGFIACFNSVGLMILSSSMLVVLVFVGVVLMIASWFNG